MFAGLGRRSPVAWPGDDDVSGEKMVGDIQDTFPPSVNYSNSVGIRTNYSGEVCQYIYTIHLTPSLSAFFRSQNGTKLLHTSGACPGDGSHYYGCIRFLTCALLDYHIKLRDLQL